MGKDSDNNKSTTETSKRIAVEDGSDKVKKSTKKAKTTAVAKVKHHMPARIIKDAEIISGPKKAPKVIEKSNKSAPKKRIIQRIEVVETKKPRPSQSPQSSPSTNTKPAQKTEKATTSDKNDMKLPLIRRLHIKIRYIVAGAIVLLIGIFFGRVALWEHNYIAAMEGTERDTATKVEEDPNEGEGIYEGGAAVDEAKPTEEQIKEHIVAPDKPRYLTIKSLNIYTAPIVEIGLGNGGELGTPNRAWYVGWYTGSVLPGENGVAMFDAHGGDLGNGIFRHLPRITAGAEIIIEMGDGRKYTYVVADKATKSIGSEANNYMDTAFTSPVAGVPSITLITCTGEWSQVQQTYLERLFVRATLKQ